VTDEIRALLARQLRGYEVTSVVELGAGLDNAAYEVNGELIVRKSKEADPARRSESTRREADLLGAVARLSTLPVPEPVFADATEGVIAYSKLSGHPLIERPVAEPARLAPALGEFMGGLHLAPLEKMEKLVERNSYPLTAWLEDAGRDYGEIAEHIPAASRRVIEEFLGHAPPAERSVEAFCHNDLGAEHVLMNAEANDITGIIDWTDAAIADPARDLALVFRDLGPGVFELTLAHYGGSLEDTDRERAVFYARCKLIKDIAYGMSNSGARHYAEAGLARLDRTFAALA